MLARQLDYSPKAEELPLVVDVMYRDLCALGLGDVDADRVAKAFQSIALRALRWPTVHMVRENLPKKEHADPALPRPPLDEIQLDHLRKIGMERRPGESMPEYARRCCRYMREQMKNGELDATPQLKQAIEERAE